MGFEEHAPLDDFLADYKNYYFSVVKFNGEKCFLKVLLKDSKHREEHFTRELEFYQSNDALTRESSYFTPRLVTFNVSHKPYWMLQQLVEGKPLTDFAQDLGRPQDLIHIIQLTNLLESMRTFPVERLHALRRLSPTVKVYDYSQFREAVRKYECDCIENSQLVYSAVSHLMRRHHDLLDSTARTLAHGDFQPRNILATKFGSLRVVDWEHFSINNPAYDVAFFWLNTGAFPVFRRKFLEHYRSNLGFEGFEELFRIAVLRFSLRAIAKKELRGTPFAPEEKQIFLDNIYRALESFECLTELPERTK